MVTNLSSFVQITGENISKGFSIVPGCGKSSIYGNSYYSFPKDVHFSKKNLERLRFFGFFFFACFSIVWFTFALDYYISLHRMEE